MIHTLKLLIILILTQIYLSYTFTQIVWIYIIEDAPLNTLQKLSISNIYHFGQLSQLEIKVITDKNYTKYLQQDQQVNLVISSGFTDGDILTKAIIQLSILQKYGGIWIDLPIIVTEPLNWLQTIKNQKYVNNRIDDPNAVLFYNPRWLDETFKRTSPKVENLVIKPNYHTWFMAIKKQSNFINDWRKLLIQLVKKSQLQREQLYKAYNIGPRDYLLDPTRLLDWTAQAAIQIMQTQLDKQHGTTPTRNLAINYYKISAIDATTTADVFNTEAKGHTHLTTKYLSQLNTQEANIKFSYLLHTSDSVQDQLATILDDQVPQLGHLHSSVILACQNQNIPYRHIISGSAVDIYLVKLSQDSEIQTYDAEYIRHHCSVAYETVFYDFFTGYIIPGAVAILHLYIVRRMILIFRPQWGIRRKIAI